jgi:DNA repair protein RadC
MPSCQSPALLRVLQAPLPREPHEAAVAVRGPEDVAAVVIPLLQDEPSEVMLSVALTAKHRVIGTWEVGRGGIDRVPCEPREVFRAALLVDAAAVVLAHNHPSGAPPRVLWMPR